MKQNPVIEVIEDENIEQINGRKMSKKDSLSQKKEEKKAEQSGQTIPQVIVQPEINIQEPPQQAQEVQKPEQEIKPVPPPAPKVLK